MKLRLANIKDIPILKHWDSKEHVINAGGADDHIDWDYEIPRVVPWCEYLMAESDDGRPIGMVQVIDPEKRRFGDDDCIVFRLNRERWNLILKP